MKRGDQHQDSPPDEHPSGGISGSRPEPQDNNGVPDDPVLLETALRGDIEAFAHLFENYRQRLHALCLKRLGDHSLAEDIVQEVFVRAFINLSFFDRRKKVWPWLATIAIRMCIDLQRQRSFTHYSGDIEPTADAGSNGEGLDGQTGSALDAVLAAEKRAELFQLLDVLPKRQRRVFLLFALDGWSCADIAAAEGISLDAVHHLLFRARKKMRITYQNGMPALIALPLTWLQGKVQRTADRVRVLLGLQGEGLSAACMQAVCLGAAAMMVVAASPLESFEVGDSQRTAEAVLSTTQSRMAQTALPSSTDSGTAPNQSQSAKFVTQPETTVAEYLSAYVSPSENLTPERTWFSSIAASPNYESDHTVLALGQYGYSKVLSSVLFTSRDGGATWKASSSRGLFGENVVFAPGYPQDQRIFTLGTEYFGLQQSDDGGEIFRTVSPVRAGSLAISPLFGRGNSILGGESKILMGGNVLLEYDAETGITQPASPSIYLSYSGGCSSITFSPAYSSDRTIFVSDCSAKADPLLHRSQAQNTLYRCRDLSCDEIHFSFDETMTFRLSPRFDQDRLAYAFTNVYAGKLLVSRDGAQTFQEVEFPLPNLGRIIDLAVLHNASSHPTLFVYVLQYVAGKSLPVVYRSLDGGSSWSRSQIDVPGFSLNYYNKLIATSTGHLFASGQGIACSVDLGQTWRPRCPPEP